MYQKIESNNEYLTQKGGFIGEKDFICRFFSGIKFANKISTAMPNNICVRKQLRRTLPILLLSLMILFIGCGDEDGIGAVFTEDTQEPPDVLQGQVILENMSDHSSIRIELKEIELSLLTDAEGSYSLPGEIAEGEWTLRASYPFFSAMEQNFVVVNGTPESDLETMELVQEVVFDVVPEKLFYTYGDTVIITLYARNMTTQEVTLSSQTSPMTAFAVRHEGVTVVGGLFPGQGAEPQSVTLGPGELQEFTMSWTIDNPELDPGEYQIYALLTTSVTHPDYFKTDSDLAEELNESLYAKLVPATISLSTN